jgi:hypothetical protein
MRSSAGRPSASSGTSNTVSLTRGEAGRPGVRALGHPVVDRRNAASRRRSGKPRAGSAGHRSVDIGESAGPATDRVGRPRGGEAHPRADLEDRASRRVEEAQRPAALGLEGLGEQPPQHLLICGGQRPIKLDVEAVLGVDGLDLGLTPPGGVEQRRRWPSAGPASGTGAAAPWWRFGRSLPRRQTPVPSFDSTSPFQRPRSVPAGSAPASRRARMFCRTRQVVTGRYVRASEAEAEAGSMTTYHDGGWTSMPRTRPWPG